MSRLLAGLLLLAGAILVARHGAPVRDRLSGRRNRIDPAGLRNLVAGLLGGPAWRSVLAASTPAAALAGLYAGPVAGSVAGVYAGLAVHEWRRRSVRKQAAEQRATHLDDLTSLVADLRAGIPPVSVVAPAGSGRIGQLTEAVWRLAERTGAPAADLLERIEADARAAERSAGTAQAHAAGTQTTAIMLAALPLAGIALGHAIGADPTGVLLHTPLGAACLLVALLLQCAGLKWAQRLTEGTPR